MPACGLADNLKSGARRANRYEPAFTELLGQLCLHCGCTPMAARAAKPRDKPHVEREAQLACQRIYAPLRHQRFTSLRALDEATGQQLSRHRQAPFQRKAGDNRQSLFELREQPLLSALPATAFEVKYCIDAKVRRNYHIAIGQGWHYYSAPCEYIGKTAQVAYTSHDVEIYCQSRRIALHRASRLRYGYTTLPAHMPPARQHYHGQRGWTAGYFLEKPRLVGPCCLEAAEQTLPAKMFIEQTYNSCLGVLRLASKYSTERLEAACCRALRGRRINYTVIHNILKDNLDKLEAPTEAPSQTPKHTNIRGPEAYQ